MLCMSSHGRMKALARLLETGSVREKSSEEVASEKFAIQKIHSQFCDADEANLLEEKDMHVFGCRPLTDPLRLVCCNACKKPVKASHYAVHAEHCSLISSTEDTALEHDGDNVHKKPPRKGRRKLQAGITDTVDTAATRNASGIYIGGKNCSSGVTGPLATKTYYSQGNHRLRTALGHLYHKTSPKEHGHDSVCDEVKQGKTMLSSQTHKGGIPQMKVDQQSAFRNNSERMDIHSCCWFSDNDENNYHSTSYTCPRNSAVSMALLAQASLPHRQASGSVLWHRGLSMVFGIAGKMIL